MAEDLVTKKESLVEETIQPENAVEIPESRDSPCESTSDETAIAVDHEDSESQSKPTDTESSSDEGSIEPGSKEDTSDEPAGEKKKDKKKLTKKQKLLRAVVKLIVKIAIIALIGWIAWNRVGEIFILHDNNMYPHIKDGSLVVTYKLEELHKDDVVLYEIDGEMKIGRIVGSTDDEIYIGEGGIFTVNGYSPYENVFYKTESIPESDVAYPLVVGEGEYFIMNDMRDNREDSRRFGVIQADAVHGKIVFMVQHRGF